MRASSRRPQQVGVNGTIDFVDCQASPLQLVNEEGGVGKHSGFNPAGFAALLAWIVSQTHVLFNIFISVILREGFSLSTLVFTCSVVFH